MLFSRREKQLLDLWLLNASPLSINYLSEKLDVSTRTIYREINKLSESLEAFQISILNDSEGFFLQGSPEAFVKLRQEVEQTEVELTTAERQTLLSILLLIQKDQLKVKNIAEYFKVSTSTVQADLEAIEDLFEEYKIQLIRRKNSQIDIIGKETDIRLIVSTIISNELNEYDFFSLFTKEQHLKLHKFEQTNHRFLQLLDPNALHSAYQAIRHNQYYSFDDVSDAQLRGLTIFLTITIMRLNQGHQITNEDISPAEYSHVRDSSIKLATYLFDVLDNMKVVESISKFEIDFLAIHIEGINFPFKIVFSEDYDIELSYKVQRLIREVSSEFQVNFTNDDNLSKNLLAHLSAALSRKQLVTLSEADSLLEKVRSAYPVLSKVIEKHLATIFAPIQFSPVEVMYVVIHFASVYEREMKLDRLNVLIVCSGGIGTAKILESRLKRYIPSIQNITLCKSSQLNRMPIESFDIILSTIFLDSFDADYTVVSPLLMEDEIEVIKKKIEQLRIQLSETDYTRKSPEAIIDFNEISTHVDIIKELIEQFELETIDNDAEMETTIRKVISSLPRALSLVQLERIVNKLVLRLEKGPIGLPNTRMALFHTVDAAVTKPYFSVFDLKQSLEMMSMNRQPMQVSRMLLMIGPEPLSPEDQKILGYLSSSIVESVFNLKVFDEGSEEMIRHYLNTIYIDYMRELIKLEEY